MRKKGAQEPFQKKHEILMKFGCQNGRFWDAKTFQNYALCNEFTIVSVYEIS